MTRLETRFPCPVCLGVKMEKVTVRGTARVDRDAAVTSEAAVAAGAVVTSDNERPRDGTSLMLDHCRRCGGVWFEAGEVQQLRRIDAGSLWREIVQRDGVHAMQCHSCRTHIQRTAAACHACGWQVELDCPICDRPMRRSEQDGMHLDFCTHCRGVWFDHDELTAIWKLEVDALVRRRGSRAVGTTGDLVLLDVLLYDPFVMYYGIHAAGHAAGAAAEAIAASGSIEVVGEVAGAAGEVASSLFETIVDIIAGILG